MRRSCTAWRNRVPPGMRASFPRSRRDHLIGAELPLFQRFERDEHATGVGRSAPSPGATRRCDHVLDGRILADCAGEACEQVIHSLERGVLIGHDLAGQAGPCPAAGKSPWARSRTGRWSADRRERNEQRDELMPQHPAQRPLIEPEDAVEDPFAGAIHPPVLFFVAPA